MTGGKIELSAHERAKWPFLQPSIDSLRTDLRDAKSTLMLMLQVATLALSKRIANASISTGEHEDSVRAIVATELQRREEHKNPPQRPEFLNVSRSIDPPKAEDRLPAISYVPEDPKNDRSTSSPSSERGSESRTNHKTELQLFLLKPIVYDLFDRIELRWSVQNTNMGPHAIRTHMAENEKSNPPSVVEVLQQLHTYEQKVVHSETMKDSGGSVLSVKRTTADIQSRDMLFKSVPGLQFVVERRLRPQGDWISRIRKRRQMRSIKALSLNRFPRYEAHYSRMLPTLAPSKDESTGELMKPPIEALGRAVGVPQLDADMAKSTHRVDTQQDDDPEAMVADLLAKYTTLSIV